MTGKITMKVPCELEVEFTHEETDDGGTMHIDGVYIAGRAERTNVLGALTDAERAEVFTACWAAVESATAEVEALHDTQDELLK